MKRANHWLDCCRCIAITLVLLSHGRRLLLPLYPQAEWFKFGGFLGVEIFFVLSGFLIGRILIESCANPAGARWHWVPHFWLRRWLRTYPNYVLFLILNLLVIDSWRPDPLPSLLHYLTFTQSLLSPHPTFFGEAWSLVIEEIFYFLVPLSMLLVWQRSVTRTLISALCLLLICSLILRVGVVYSDPELTFNQIRSTALLRLDSLMVGVLGAWAFWKGGRWRSGLQRVSPWMACLLLPVIIIAMQPDHWIDVQAWLKICLFPLANIGALGLLVMGYHWTLPSFLLQPVRYVARWSYSAYLANLLVLSAMGYYFAEPNRYMAIPYWLLFWTGTLAVAALVYYQFESRILRWRDRMVP